MTTPAKAKANRRNARRSTGPRTARGKARSSRNALSHGLTAEATVLLPGEDPEEFETFAAEMRDELAPVGRLEQTLAARVVSTAWRLERLSIIEAGILASP